MKRILIRGRKSPFEVVTPEATFERNVIGTNSGNLVFLAAAYKLVATRGTTVETYGGRPRPADADRINEEADVFVVPLANAFRRDFEAHLVALTDLIERLRIPVVILGVGAQAGLDYDTSSLRPMAASVAAFARAALDHGPTIGVRGELTQSYLRELGFRDVEVIGCPSMFLNGERLDVAKKATGLAADSRIAINVSPGVPQMDRVIERHVRQYPQLSYIAQDLDELGVMLWGKRLPAAPAPTGFPRDTSHPLLRDNRARFFVDPWPWIAYLRDFDFTFGTRIHGNIVSLLAGTPAFVLAHDSRTLELARYHSMPHGRVDELAPDVDARELYEAADFNDMLRGHRHRFGVFADYLGRHGLEHVYQPGQSPEDFEARVQATAYPPAVTLAAPRRRPAVRLSRLRYDVRRLSRSTTARRLSGLFARARRGLRRNDSRKASSS